MPVRTGAGPTRNRYDPWTSPTVAVTVAASVGVVARKTPELLTVPLVVDHSTSSRGIVAPYWSYPVAVKVVVVPGTRVFGSPSARTTTSVRRASIRDVICVCAGTAICPMTSEPSYTS